VERSAQVSEVFDGGSIGIYAHCNDRAESVVPVNVVTDSLEVDNRSI